MEKGIWIFKHEQLGIVKEFYEDEEGNLVDIILYDRNGNKVGRSSPHCGGPRTFEPCCEAEGWKEIEKPKFPLTCFNFLKDIVEIKD